mmetsp:Transcript_23832/g.52510  ORF Transcript_23832/g.52510 Transcript_23832/m.52510 type:complete len:243 (-) Transcript_23832:124-852(-)
MASPQSPTAQRSGDRPKQWLAPVTAAVLLKAKRAPGGEKLMLHSQVADRITMVGKVVAKEETATATQYHLEDPTGTVAVRDYRDKRAAVQVEVGQEVRVIGQARVHDGPVTLSIMFMAPAQEDEAEFHRTEVEYVAWKLENTTATILNFLSPEKSAEAGVKRVAADTNVATPAKKQPKAAFRDEVLAFLRTAPSEKGYSVTEVQKQFADIPGEQVKSALAELEDETDAYTTLDRDHFAAMEV